MTTQPLRVLIVEDNPDDADLVLNELRRAGFNPDSQRVATEQEFQECLRPDLDIILSDYQLSGFGGLRALELRDQHGLSTPILIISGAIEEDLAAEAMKHGAADYLLKDRLARLGPAVHKAVDQSRTQEQIKRLLEHSPAVIYSLKIEGASVVPQVVSENITRLLGFTVEESCSFEWWDSHLHPEDRRRAIASIAETIDRRVQTCEYRICHKNGEYVWVEDNRRLVRDPGGQPMEIAGAWTDITERRKLQAEVALQDQRLSAFFSGAVAGLALLDQDLRYVQINDTLAEMNGVPRADHLGRTVREVLPVIAPVLEAQFHKILATGKPMLNVEISGETPLHPGVQRHWIESMFPIAGTDGHPNGVGVIVVELTERKRMEESLRLSEERFHQLAENIQEVFWVTEVANNQLLYVSPAYESIWGRTCDSLYANPDSWMDAIHEDDRERVLHAITVQMNGTFDEEFRIVRPGGAVRWIHDRAFPVRDGAGVVYRMVGVAQDITDRKRSEDQLREQASLLDKARDAILVSDFEHRITYWNKGAERLYGWTAAEVMGQTIFPLLYLDIPQFYEATEAAIRLGDWTGELQQVNKAGAHILIESRWTLVHDAEGRPKGILAINTDITEKKNLEQQFLRAQRLESIGALAGGIAHDLNNMLCPIMMSVDLLKLTHDDAHTQAVLSTIETSAKRGSDMVQQILSFARGVEGQRVMIAPREIIRDIQYLIQDTFPKNIIFNADLAADLPAFLGDHTQVHQVLLNLCLNARDAMPDGGKLTISAASLTVDDSYAAMQLDAKPGRYAMIQVEDSGTGIAQDVADKIFDPFFTTKEIGKGTGLGLSTVRTIVMSHGGFVSVQSKPGSGTTFTVCFPATLSGVGITRAEDQVMHPRGHGELILVVDDEAAVRAVTQQTLEAFGYRVLVAADGAEAIALYAEHQNELSVVLTDMMMPTMDGPATIQVLKRMNPAIKIIAASGLNAESSAAKAAGMGVKHFLPKPYTAQTLLMALDRVLNASTRGPTGVPGMN